MKTTAAAALRTFTVYVMTRRGLIEHSTALAADAADAADAVRIGLNLARRPSQRHDGPHGSGFLSRGLWFTATAETPAACPLCGEAHEITAADRAPQQPGEVVTERVAIETAHYRLAILATSARPFDLRGGRAA